VTRERAHACAALFSLEHAAIVDVHAKGLFFLDPALLLSLA
jgi:hypothetical protein